MSWSSFLAWNWIGIFCQPASLYYTSSRRYRLYMLCLWQSLTEDLRRIAFIIHLNVNFKSRLLPFLTVFSFNSSPWFSSAVLTHVFLSEISLQPSCMSIDMHPKKGFMSGPQNQCLIWSGTYFYPLEYPSLSFLSIFTPFINPLLFHLRSRVVYMVLTPFPSSCFFQFMIPRVPVLCNVNPIMIKRGW